MDRTGFPVAGWIGFAWTSIVDACTGGYSEPGFCETGRVTEGTDDVVSTLGVNEGV